MTATDVAVLDARRTRVRLIVILGALTAIGPLSIDMYLPALPSLSAGLHTTASPVQLTITACLVGLAAGQVLAGPVSDARGRRLPLLAGMVLYTVSSLLCMVAPDVAVLIVLRLLQGASGAAGIVIARAMVRDLYDGDDAARFFSVLMLVNGLAPVLAPVIGGQLLRFTDWRGIFLVVGGVAAVLLAASFAGIPETLPEGGRRGGGLATTAHSFGRLCRDRRFVGYALSGGLAFAAMFSYISGSPFVIEKVYGLSAQEFSLIFAVNGAGIVIFGVLSGRLVGRAGQQTLLGAGLVMQLAGGAILLAGVAAGGGLPVVLPALFLVVSGIGFITPNASALALTGWPSNLAGSASALLGVTQFVTGGAMAPIVGVGGEHTALPMAALIACQAFAATFCFAVLCRGPRDDQSRMAPGIK
jgi:DHA1 family bicyclomycin/chloramphenicol resistance-like MFS transporter